MSVTDRELERAAARMQRKRDAGHALSARYDRWRRRVVVRLNTGIEVAFPPELAEGLAGASSEDPAEIEIGPSGLGLHWPTLDADLHVPALLRGVLGSRSWMAAHPGAASDRSRSPAKAKAARENGRKGGRPRRDRVAGEAGR
ncbi:MAG: DUF2442 domain-containing protein [Defluviicoccus sp.]|nr:DUF2442 domain-containing protein [Defluviicoccus sp.]MDE0383724.1 DUF2442 domain-containing protein [Defluviicoccus sp.]